MEGVEQTEETDADDHVLDWAIAPRESETWANLIAATDLKMGAVRAVQVGELYGKGCRPWAEANQKLPLSKDGFSNRLRKHQGTPACSIVWGSVRSANADALKLNFGRPRTITPPRTTF